MALINTSVPNLIQGVSQQPDATRFTGQCEEQENALSSVADGLKKRPNTRHIAKLLTTAISEDSFVHFINRSDAEKYVVIHDGTHLYAFNTVTGVEAEIKVGIYCYKASWTTAEVTAHNTATPANTTTYVDTGYPVSGSYLNSSQAIKDLKALTIADGTFLLNSEQQVGLGSTYSPELEKEALVFVKQGDYSKKYNIHLQGSFATGGAAGNTATATINMISSGGNNMKVGSVTINNGGTLYEAGTTTTFSIPTSHSAGTCLLYTSPSPRD